MRALLLGAAVLVLGLLGVSWFMRANPATLARNLRRIGGVVALLIGVVAISRGAASIAVPLFMLGLWLLSGGGGLGSLGGGSQKSPGQTSRIVTDHLEMELDHDTGAVRGRVLKGMFAGRNVQSMRPEELALLWQDCRHVDQESAQIIEAYLDQRFPSWREDVRRGEDAMSRGADGRMSVEEALEILGLKAGASREEIRRAHRDLMLKLHPDRGGSTYLATKINEAKDVALENSE